MNLKLYFFFSLLLFLIPTSAYSQTVTDEFKPSGKVIATAFFDYSTGLNSHSNQSGFDLTRALIGYNYKFHPKLEATVSIDGAAGRSTDGDMEVYFRNAFLSWTEGKFNLKVGLTNTVQFNLQQSIWSHRYALKSQQDFIGMGNSVDLGLIASYDFSSKISADLSITNGEGNKTIRKDKSLRYGLGLTYSPIENLFFRAYADIYTKDKNKMEQSILEKHINDQYTYSLFAGYQNKLLSAGIEYNKQFDSSNVKGSDLTAISIYSTVNINTKWNVYGRYDYTDSSHSITDQYGWFDDHQAIIIGIEYKPFDFLSISPNFRNYNYDRSPSEQYIFINGEFSF